MIFFLNVLFYLVTAASAICGLLAKHWEKNKPDLSSRVGSVTLGCIVLLFIISVLKEYRTGDESEKEKTRNTEVQRKLQDTINAQSTQIGNLLNDLKKANTTIDDTRTKLVEAQLSSRKTTDAIQAYVYNNLSGSTSNYLGLLGRMMGEASDEWLPQTQEEFFSRRTVNLICHNLNIEGEAPVFFKRQWFQYFQEESRNYEESVVKVFSNYVTQMSPSLITAISKVVISRLLSLPKEVILFRRADQESKQLNKSYINRPPILCLGAEKEIEKSFAELSELMRDIALGEKIYSLTPRITNRMYLQTLKSATFRKGGNRFTDPELSKWIEIHGQK